MAGRRARAAAEVAADYLDFAATHTRGVSPRYEQWARGVAGDPELVAALLALPAPKRQPNLLFAATRYVAGTPDGYPEFRAAFFANRRAIEQVMLARRTQTNEPARCAAFYPLLAALRQPLALLEVGASAGLCLLPDRYRYEYNGVPAGDQSSPVTIACQVEGEWAQPGPIEVAWRAGIDLNPLSVHDPDEMAWLESLIWPGQEERVHRLRAAVALAQRDPPRLVRGDLNERLPELAATAPKTATLVVYHTATLIYLSDVDRRRFEALTRAAGARWLAQEASGVLSWLPIDEATAAAGSPTQFLVSLDGRPVAWTAPHGGRLRWLTATG